MQAKNRTRSWLLTGVKEEVWLIRLMVCVVGISVALFYFTALTMNHATTGPTYYFNHTVEVSGITHSKMTAWPFATPVLAVKITLLRSGMYTRYPKDVYDVRITVPHSTRGAQSATLAAGEVDQSYVIDLQWEWEPGTIAAQRDFRPKTATVAIVRKSDQQREEKAINLLLSGGSMALF